ncbi:adenylate/guanylate cyclase domain-containing protein [Bradyrhizobium sp. B124]|uniref:adenylate/guanylate cyclase domain-containing protein n=1 Tax=Bradyrhizobium sp. B124 TaxID=3140245 RepID=UPI003183CDBC
MHCPACGCSAPKNARFCPGCGAKLSLRCEACGFESPPEFRFCGGCGAPLAEHSPIQRLVEHQVAAASRAADRDQRPERRQVTVLFIDMVGSTDLSVCLDDEEFKDVIYKYRDTCANAVRQFDGTIVRYIGDGILVCFGFPLAHEDDPIRAVRAALSLLEGMRQLNRQESSGAPPIHMRMGMHTGIVIAGDLRSSDTFETMGILGETPNIAARLQQLAAPDSLVITDATAQLIGGRFNLRDLGPQEIRGTHGTMNLFEVVGERADPAFDAARGGQKMIGRSEEVALLRDRFIQAMSGEGQLVLITGEAGAGKTRLVRNFRDMLDGSAFLPFTCYCSAYNRESAFYPIIEMIRRVVNLDGLADVEDKIANVQRAFAGLDSITPEAVPLVSELLELPVPLSLREVSPSQRRELLLDLLAQWLLRQSEQLPILFIVEDLHWADASTSSLLERIVQQISDWRAMAIFTFRPEFRAEWLLESQGTRLGLRHLSASEARTLVEQVAGATPLPANIVEHIVAKTGGIPLFVEELTKTVLAETLSSAQGDPALLTAVVDSIPSTLRGSLVARLDRLKVAKPLAQVAATLGRTFDSEVLGAVTGESQHSLREQLAELLHEGFIQQHGVPVHAKYSFRHALIQDAAYDSLLKSERRLMHRKIADVLSTQFREIVAATPEVLAQHYAAANLAEAAISQWEAAGKKAAERSANVEAASHFANALAILRRLPDTPERARRELLLEVDRGSQLLATQGNAAPQVEEVFTRAYELSEGLGEHHLLFRALYGLMMFCIVRGQLEKAHGFGVRLIERAERADDRGLLLQAKRPLGLTLFYLGKFDVAKKTLEEALQLYDPDQHHHHRFEYGSDPAVLAQCNLAWTEWFVGLADSAVKDSAQAIDRAVQLDHPHSLGFALSFDASIRQARGEPNETLEAAERTIQVGQTYRFPYWSAWGRILRGWAVGKLGRLSEGAGEIEQGLADYRATGAELIRPYGLMLFAETLVAKGEADNALKLLDEALAITASNKTLFCEPELHRLRGEVLLALNGESEDASSHFVTAVELARELGAHALELRALLSLVSVATGRNHRSGIERLKLLHGQMVEGFGTADLIETARVLNLAAIS